MKKQKIEPIEDENYVIRDLTIEEIVPNNIDNFLVSIYEDRHLVVVPPNTLGIQFKNWKKSRGGQFSKDVLYHTLKKNSEVGKYVLIKGKDKNFIARLITEDEKLKFESLKLIDGQIKDVSYMILRHLQEEDNLTSTKLNIYEKLNEEEFQSSDYYPSSAQPLDEDVEFHSGSVSLFSNDE